MQFLKRIWNGIFPSRPERNLLEDVQFLANEIVTIEKELFNLDPNPPPPPF